MGARPASWRSDTAAWRDAAERPPWHMLKANAVTFRLETDARGLSPLEVNRRLARGGFNQLAEKPSMSPLVILLHQFRSPLIYILVAATLITVLLGEFIDPGVIAAVLVLNAIIGFTQERRAEQSVWALMHLMAPKAHVDRGRRDRSIDRRQRPRRRRRGVAGVWGPHPRGPPTLLGHRATQ